MASLRLALRLIGQQSHGMGSHRSAALALQGKLLMHSACFDCVHAVHSLKACGTAQAP